MDDFLAYTRSKSPGLADALEQVCATRLEFEGDYPLAHSSANHVHLWFLEYRADTAPWIDTTFRTRFIKYVLEHWRVRLKGMAPYRDRGYRMYVYEDAAPTLSVVAETDIGFPYRFGTPIRVDKIEEIAALYADRSWQQRFAFEPFEISDRRVLKAVEEHQGSISKPTAHRLGLKVGKLRLLIGQMDLGDEVNRIRKHYRRRPVLFPEPGAGDEEWHVFERLLRPGYR